MMKHADRSHRGHCGRRGRRLASVAVALVVAVWFLPAVTVTVTVQAQAAVSASVRMLAVHLFHPTNPQAYAGAYEQAQVPIEYRCPYGSLVVVAVEMDGQAQIGGNYAADRPGVQGVPACTGATQSALITLALSVPPGGYAAPMLPGLQAMTARMYYNGQYPNRVLARDVRRMLADTAPILPVALAVVPLYPEPYRMHVHGSATTANATWRPPLDLLGHVVAGYWVRLYGHPAVRLPATARSYSYTGLLPDTDALIIVSVVFADPTRAGWFADSWITGGKPSLSNPVDHVVAQPGPTSMTLRWESPQIDGWAAVTGYLVARDGVDAGGHGPYSTVVPGSATSCVFTNLRPGVPYTFTVQPVTAAGTGPAADPVTAAAG